MFIAWINQIVALMDKKEGPAVHNILHQLATYYPQVSHFTMWTSFPHPFPLWESFPRIEGGGGEWMFI